MKQAVNGSGEPVGLYVHIPFCARKCNYCDFPSFSGLEKLFADYAEAVCREIEMLSDKYCRPAADTVFFGGGTPSILPVDYTGLIVNAISKHFITHNDLEYTLEANPGTLTSDNLKAYKSLGFNRISIGLQAGQDRLLRSMGRIHTRDMFIQCVDLAKKYGFDNINADIIFGVPGQTMADWNETLELVLGSGVNHVSCYSLNIEENTPWDEMKKRGELPDIDDSLEREMYYRAITRLSDAGFGHYEISNFSMPGKECRHNLKYWTGKPYVGIGAAAHSFINGIRTANRVSPAEYIQIIKEGRFPEDFHQHIGAGERLSERFMLGLRLIAGVSLGELSQEFGQDAIMKYMGTIDSLKKNKLVNMENDRLMLSKTGLDFANRVWMEFL